MYINIILLFDCISYEIYIILKGIISICATLIFRLHLFQVQKCSCTYKCVLVYTSRIRHECKIKNIFLIITVYVYVHIYISYIYIYKILLMVYFCFINNANDW